MKRTIFGATAAVALMAAGAASAATVTQQVATDWTTAKGFETDYLNSIAGTNILTEDFEGLALQTNTTISTAVGDFTQVTQGQIAAGLRILDDATTPFSGRRDMTFEDNSGQWLDSNDSKEVTWTVTFAQTILSLGFFMTDINDVSASMTATFINGGSETFSFASPCEPTTANCADNGEISYITAFFDSGVSSITFNVNTPNDGWGIDDITVSAVPLPAPALMLLGGLGALAAVRRKRKSA